MGRKYWIGLGLFFAGAGLWNAPTGDYRLYTVILGVLVEAAGAVLVILGLLDSRRAGREGGRLPRRMVVIMIACAVLFLVVGAASGFLLLR